MKFDLQTTANQRKAVPIILLCMVLPYLLLAYFVPGNKFGQYVKHYASSYLHYLGTSYQSKSTGNLDSAGDAFASDEDNDTAIEITTSMKSLQSSEMLAENARKEPTSKNVNSVALPSSKAGLDIRNPPLKKILIWNRKLEFGGGSLGRQAFINLGCKVNTCTVTNKRNLFPYRDLDAVIWHERSRDNTLPPTRSSHTRYIFMLLEPPGHVKKNLRKYSDVFNWTLTYRLDADIQMRIGQFVPKTPPDSVKSSINYATGKTKMAAWFVSNCGADSGRAQLTKQLQKYIKVDVYGKCGPLKCRRFGSFDCYKMVEKNYKFYFSFENSICKDYVTEKFFNILKYNVVPIVYGGANYARIAPQKSYINALDFPSIEDLAKYLLYLNSNDTAYNEYFWWKNHYKVLAVGGSKSLAWCDLCEKLHTDNTTHSYKDLHDWYIKGAKCKTKKYGDIKKFLKL